MKYLNYDRLSAEFSNEQAEQIHGLIENKINPKLYSSVQKWAKQWHNEPIKDELVMCAINEILNGYGVEVIEGDEWKDYYWQNIVCTYVNMRNSYLLTVIYDRDNGFIFSSIGDLIETTLNV
jgi:hypothetical protein